MYREINKKKLILERRMPFAKDTYEYITEVNLTDFIYSMMRLDGSLMTKEMITSVLKEGAFYPEISLSDHAKVHRYVDLLSYIRDMHEMQTVLSIPVLKKMHSILSDTDRGNLRKNNSIVFEWNYRPPYYYEIEKKLTTLMNWIGRDGKIYDKANPLETPDLIESPSDYILRSAYLHNRIASICPFSTGNAEIARAAMYYYLTGKGMPLFSLDINEQEYNDMISDYLVKGDIVSMKSCIARALYSKMELMMRLTE